MNRSQKYYGQVAVACDALLSDNAGAIVNGLKITGSNESLPSVVRELHPDYVLVNTNGVGIRIGIGRGSYWITWARSETNREEWYLRTNAEGLERVVYPKK